MLQLNRDQCILWVGDNNNTTLQLYADEAAIKRPSEGYYSPLFYQTTNTQLFYAIIGLIISGIVILTYTSFNFDPLILNAGEANSLLLLLDSLIYRAELLNIR